MGASRYIGRVGGLAVAAGAGVAIFFAIPTAAADTTDASQTSKSSESAPSSRSGSSSEADTSAADKTGDDNADDSDSADDDSEEEADAAADAAEEDVDLDDTVEADEDDASPPTATASAEQTSLDVDEPATTHKITYDADIEIDNGVITGTNTAPTTTWPWKTPLTYHVTENPSTGGKPTIDETTGNFTFLPDAAQLTDKGAEQFSVLIAETTWFDAALEKIPGWGVVLKPILVDLHRVPILKDLLVPLIGRSTVVTVNVPVGELYSGATAPIAYTTKITSFDGTQISVNWFPKIGLGAGDTAPTILNGPSLATAGYTNLLQETTVGGLVPGISTVRAAGYNVVTWDPRGEFASGGVLHLDSQDYEARDVMAIIDWVAKSTPAAFDPTAPGAPANTTDPLVGMMGGSYGGGIQLNSAGIDTRIDAIVPGIAWNNLTEALYPNKTFKTSWASILLLSLVAQRSRIDDEIYYGILTGIVTGKLTQKQQDFLSGNSPFNTIANISAPTLFLQGSADGLFTLKQALDNAAGIPDNVPVKMIWYCGGHGACLDPSDTQGQTDFLVGETLGWLNTYVMNKQVGPPPPIDDYKFTWVDQKGSWYASDLLPSDGEDFYGKPVTVVRRGGLLPIAPGHNGSGPQHDTFFPLSIVSAAKAKGAINIPVPRTLVPRHFVGAPEITLTYSGLGTSRSVYAQLVDNRTGRVLGNLVTPIDVKLDGKTNTVTVSMENIAYTETYRDSLTLQIVDSATAYEDFSAYGIINISEVRLSIPTATNVVPLDMASAAGEALAPKATSLEDLLLGARP